jgi:hypothetical protein
MKVIGVGLPKTGTLSLKDALNILGYKTHHGGDVHSNVGNMKFWVEYLTMHEEGRANPTELKAYYDGAGWTASCDFPTAAFYKELVELYPNAKFILTLRDPEAWFRSRYRMLVWEAEGTRSPLFRLLVLMRFPRYLLYPLLLDQLDGLVYGETVMRWLELRASLSAEETEAHYRRIYLRVFEEHSAAVRRAVPAAQLLEYHVQEKWAPLCAFLGREEPSEPFPHSNEGLATLDGYNRSSRLFDLATSPLVWLVASGAVLALLSLRKSK